nr:unnamed protein product [Spirometra erinaceieuropaei]
MLVPILFLIYVDDAARALECEVAMFADDMKIWSVIRVPADEDRLQMNLNRLEEWSNRWLLRFNVAKCSILRLGNTARSASTRDYFLGGAALQEVEAQRDLGVLTTSSRKPSAHCSRVAKSAMSVLYAIKRLTTGKQPRQPVTATPAAGQSRPSRLFCISDKSSDLRFLVDTGAEISVIPPSRRHHFKPSQFSLQAANSTTINTYGQRSLTFDIGIRRRFHWVFLQADVKSPITGTDVLTHFSLAVDLKHRKLVDTTTTLFTTGIAASEPSVSIQLTVRSSPFADNLKDYSFLNKPCQLTEEVQHTVKHHIVTTGQPVYAHRRRLHPEKLRIARNELSI